MLHQYSNMQQLMVKSPSAPSGSGTMALGGKNGGGAPSPGRFKTVMCAYFLQGLGFAHFPSDCVGQIRGSTTSLLPFHTHLTSMSLTFQALAIAELIAPMLMDHTKSKSDVAELQRQCKREREGERDTSYLNTAHVYAYNCIHTWCVHHHYVHHSVHLFYENGHFDPVASTIIYLHIWIYLDHWYSLIWPVQWPVQDVQVHVCGAWVEVPLRPEAKAMFLGRTYTQ